MTIAVKCKRLTLKSLCNSAPQLFWVQWSGHMTCFNSTGLVKLTRSNKFSFSTFTDGCTDAEWRLIFDRYEQWSAGCQSYVYARTSKKPSWINWFIRGTISSASSLAGHLSSLRVPLMKSFCTSMMTSALTGETHCGI